MTELKKMSQEKIKAKILEENAKDHNACAAEHNKYVPYISRRSTRNFIWNLIRKQLKDNKKSLKDKKVLEIGCGTGTFAKLALADKAQSYTGLDLSKNMIEIAKNTAPKKLKTEFFVNDLESFAAKEENQNQYDVILASSFLHHLFDLEEGLEQIKSMLAEDGVFVCTHELDSSRQKTELEHFDHSLHLFVVEKKYLQPKTLKKGLLKLLGLLKALRKFLIQIKLKKDTKIVKLFGIKFINISPAVKTVENKVIEKVASEEVDWVDYQLNKPYNLQTNGATKFGYVVPYCFYNFEFLKMIKKKNNHHAFVMKK
jgi:2-polyprenyl-3-methyl-5-hydroxy-6-metoxy-1,4-benzoquinol methylase